ncbi:MAG: diaminopimelate epimerase [Bacteroidota bacterium]
MIPFYKYQGAGNDFVMIDNRTTTYLTRTSNAAIHHLCDRRFGIGADGLILLQNHPDYDFEMVYFNANGTEGSLCGNGGRCTVAFAKQLGIIDEECIFWAIDGEHRASINRVDNWVELKMADLHTVHCHPDHYELNTGSPHYIKYVDNLAKMDVFREGSLIRNNDTYKEKGINVNFIEPADNGFQIRTFERGVEAETLACGTGVTAAAISYALEYPNKATTLLQQGGISAKAAGGNLSVRFQQRGSSFEDIWLCGPAEFVFSGHITLSY